METKMVGWELQMGDLGNLGVAFWISTGLAIFFGLIAIVLPMYFYGKSRRIKQLAYTVATANLIQDSDKISGLKIEYKGKNPSNISVSKVALWNDGTDPIHSDDIAPSDPLRLVVTGGELLDANLVLAIWKANQFRTAIVGGELQVSFDFLDKNQGGIIQIMHTAKLSDNIELKGTVIGAQPVSRRTFGLTKAGNMIQSILLVSTVGLLIIIDGSLTVLLPMTYGGFLPLALTLIAVYLWWRFATRTFPRMVRSVPFAFEPASQVV